MTPKLSNLDIPEIKAAAAEWALVSSQIEKITLHRFKPPKIQNPEGPFYAIIIWVSPEVDVTITPWEELINAPDGKAPRAQVREQYKGQDGDIDTEKIEKHPLYDLWKLFDNLSDPIGRGYFDSFYRDGFERSDPRFDWIVLLMNIGAESLFEQGEEHNDLDNTAVGRVLLFSRKAEATQKHGMTNQTPISAESCGPKTKRWIPGWELRERWGRYEISYYDIVDTVVNGELTAYNLLDHTPLDIDIEKQCKDQIGAFAEEHGKIALMGISLNSVLENQKKDLILFVTQSLDEFLFRVAEVEEYEHSHGLIPQKNQSETTDPSTLSQIDRVRTGEPLQMQGVPVDQSAIPNSSTPDRAASTEHTDPEAFMRSLSVAYLSDTEVSVKVGNMKPEKFTSKEIGFDKKPKLWQPFIKILQATDKRYSVGIYSKYKDPIKNKNYNNLVKQLSNFSKQFVKFLNDRYSASLPEGFNVYQNMKIHEKAGTYKLKFHVVDSHDTIHNPDINSMLQENILNKIKELSERLKQEKDQAKIDQLLKNIGIYARHAVNNPHARVGHNEG